MVRDPGVRAALARFRSEPGAPHGKKKVAAQIRRDDAVKVAAEYLGAHPLGPRDREEWAWYAEETATRWVAPEDDLEDLGRRLIAGEPSAYSRWAGEPSVSAVELGRSGR